MLKKLLGVLWRGVPKSVRRLTMRVTQPRFAVTAGAVVVDDGGRVLLLNHVFRIGSGWGIPGGFIEKGEQPERAVRRELEEEIGLRLERVELAFVRTLRRPQQVEIIFRCRPQGEFAPRSLEIKSAAWFAPDAFPAELNRDQRKLINRALGLGAQPQI
ncbi:MAG TPA: NUDIX domain-containing protein [Pyrinomonadaceae bacterium]|jgi:ADP-ribose pyrophosphatase YjhB (NUDIX family)